ncbi:hypothetical protein MHF_0118 [Mycoplasma haemofelis Ohio2]|uniref:Transmembrane protein n=1 Tax=Mycoplasma haemofelis (strain Ohio2) TaxID=859194 RepID=F6FFM7_MYCHI|nr:hypothetical protein MHF_0118 [Mycoplasma haemofelis Ohio2]
MFSVHGFREQLKEPLRKVEIQFLIRTFSSACMFFALFGLFVIAGAGILTSVGGGWGWFLSFVCAIVGFVLYFPLSIVSGRYRSQPIAQNSSFVTTAYTLLLFTFFFLFMAFSTTLFQVAGGSPSIGWIAKITFLVFGTTLCVYMFPVWLGFHISNKGTILTLQKFLNVCAVAYFVLFIVLLFTSLFGFGLSEAGPMVVLMYLLTSIFLLASPIISVYRMRTVIPYINHEDPIERKRWENFFAFEISFQLLQLAYHIARIVASFMAHRNSRLE